MDKNKHETSDLYITVFNCGEDKSEPFCVHIETPTDKVNGNPVELAQEMSNIIISNKDVLSKVQKTFKNPTEKRSYFEARASLDNRLKVKQIIEKKRG